MSPQMVQIINKFSFNSSEALRLLKNLGFPEKAWLPKGGDFKHQSSRWEITSMGQGGLPGGPRLLPQTAGLCHGADRPVMCRNFKSWVLEIWEYTGNIYTMEVDKY